MRTYSTHRHSLANTRRGKAKPGEATAKRSHPWRCSAMAWHCRAPHYRPRAMRSFADLGHGRAARTSALALQSAPSPNSGIAYRYGASATQDHARRIVARARQGPACLSMAPAWRGTTGPRQGEAHRSHAVHRQGDPSSWPRRGDAECVRRTGRAPHATAQQSAGVA